MKYSTILAGLVSVASAAKSYDGYRTYRVTAGGDAAGARAALNSIELEDIWEDKLDTSGGVDVVIPPNLIETFEALGLESTVLQEDLGAAIAAESAPPAVSSMLSVSACCTN